MPVLKAKVAGSWVNIGVGGGITAGGVAGDILIKQSSTDQDALWGTTIPKLTLGNLTTTQYPTQLALSDSQHATSRRVTLDFGSNWQLIQDFAANNTRDFTIYQKIGGISAAVFNQAATALQLSVTNFAIGGNQNLKWYTDGSTYSVLGSTYAAYYDGTSHNFRNVAGAARATLAADGSFSCVGWLTAGTNLTVSGNTIYWNGGGAGGGYIQANQIYFADWAGGWNMSDATYIRSTNNKQIYSGGKVGAGGGMWTYGQGGSIILLYNETDTNHSIGYSGEAAAAIDPGSGTGSNGVKIQGYATVWLRTAIDGFSFLFYTKNSYLNAAGVYSKFSKRELKDDITLLDPDECLASVMRWEPVDYIPKGHDRRQDGFIAEDMYEVSPNLVVVTAPDQETPGPTAIDYGAFTPRLTGAVQALLRRIEHLEQQLEGRAA